MRVPIPEKDEKRGVGGGWVSFQGDMAGSCMLQVQREIGGEGPLTCLKTTRVSFEGLSCIRMSSASECLERVIEGQVTSCNAHLAPHISHFSLHAFALDKNNGDSCLG